MHVCSTLWPVSNRLWFAGCLQRVLVSLVKRLMDMRIVRQAAAGSSPDRSRQRSAHVTV
jgi:hypothetical protein